MATRHVKAMRVCALAVLAVLAVGAVSASASTTTKTFSGTVSVSGTRAILHSFSAPAGATVSIKLSWSTSAADLYLTARTADNTLIVANRTADRPKLLSFVAPTTGTYGARVRAQSGSSSYSLSVSVTSNSAPTAQPDTASTTAGQAVTITPLANDSDVDGDALTLKSVTTAAGGSVVKGSSGQVTYTPAAGFSGNDSFGYTVCDDRSPSLCSSSTVSVSVAPAVVSGSGLRWAPPTLTNPITINLPANGSVNLNLDNARDYVIKYPSVRRVGELFVHGGRNIVIVGGASTIAPHAGTGVRNIQLSDTTGVMNGRVIHIEGLDINGSGGGEGDGIGIGTPSAIVQLENVRITGLIGHLHSTHADVIQTWGGVKALRMYNVTGSSHYNNLYLRRENSPLSPAIGPVTLDHVNLFGYVNPSSWDIPATIRAMSIGTQPADNDGGPSNADSSTNCQLSNGVTLNDFYGDPPGGGKLQRFMWPTDYMGTSGCASSLTGNGLAAYWPALAAKVSGVMQLGPPPGGDFVPAGAVGVGYVSPGYQAGS